MTEKERKIQGKAREQKESIQFQIPFVALFHSKKDISAFLITPLSGIPLILTGFSKGFFRHLNILLILTI